MQVKRLMRISDFYRAVREGLPSLGAGARGMKKDKQFAERVMLAVTEVNGCQMCSQAHTQIALEAGLASSEIAELLSGGADEAVPEEHAVGVIFAQHYADTAGRPTRDSWRRLVAEYGPQRAREILGWIRMIYIGNAAGIPLSLFRARRRGEPDPRSSVVSEVGTIAGDVLVVPVALAHGVFDRFRRRPWLTFKEASQNDIDPDDEHPTLFER